MLKLKLAAAATAAAALGLLSAGSAQAAFYPGPAIAISVSDSSPNEGSTFTVNAASGGADCEWTARFNGSTKSGDGESFRTSFKAPSVDEDTDFSLVVQCEYDDTEPISNTTDSGSSDAINAVFVPTATQTAQRTVTITVINNDGDDDDDGDSDGNTGNNSNNSNNASNGNGALPDTGGSNVELLWIGGGLLVAGAAVTVVARRKGAQV